MAPQERYDAELLRGPRDSSAAPASSAMLRYGGLFLAVAAVAGVVGYLSATLGVSTRSSERVASPAAAPTALLPAAHHETTERSWEPPAAPRQSAQPATTGVPTRRTKNDDAAVAAFPPAAPPAPPPPPARPPEDPEETAAKLKLGADLLASGDIPAARMMFERAAEAGNAAGAFALAETYDPLVLNAMRVRGGVVADPIEARRWYEKARDLGSSAAPARIMRLTGR